MLSKNHRLNLSLEKNSSIFERSNSFLISSSFFLFYFRTNDSHLMVSCLAPKKIFSKATERNKYRRLLYLMLEDFIEKGEISLLVKLDLVIVYKKSFVENQKNNEDLLKTDFLNAIRDLQNKVKDAKIV